MYAGAWWESVRSWAWSGRHGDVGPRSPFRDTRGIGDLFLELTELGAHRINILAARRAVGHEAGAVMDRIDRYRPGRNSHHRLARRDVLRDDRVGADLGAFTDFDRA